LGFAGEENDGWKKERFYRRKNEGEAVIVIKGRDVDKIFGRDLNPSIILLNLSRSLFLQHVCCSLNYSTQAGSVIYGLLPNAQHCCNDIYSRSAIDFCYELSFYFSYILRGRWRLETNK
jgi:hypothetical protein